jgi:flagellar hook assembly protein FlgD
VSLKIYDVAGHLIRVLRNAVVEPAGRHQVNWEGKNNFGQTVAAGVYFYRLEAGSFSATKRMVLMK